MPRDRFTLQDAREDAETYYRQAQQNAREFPETQPGADAEGSDGGGPTGHYAPGRDRPLTGYAALSSVFWVGMVGSVVAMRMRGRELPERIGLGDVLTTGIAAHKLSRLIAKDKVASFLRAPFTRFQDFAGHGEVEEEAYGHGFRRAVGELLVCPYCLGMWSATGLTIGLIAAPRPTRLFSSVLLADAVSDFMQIAYHAAEREA